MPEQPSPFEQNELSPRDPSFERIRFGFHTIKKQRRLKKANESGTLVSSPQENKDAAPVESEEKNEDAILVNPKQGLFAIFDGMGGHQAGEVASQLAKEFIEQRMTALPEDLEPEEVKEAIKKVLIGASEKVEEDARTSANHYGMGTTASIIQFSKDSSEKLKVVIGHVGDSRVYRYRNGRIEQITVDDSDVAKYFSQEKMQVLLKELINTTKEHAGELSQDATIFKRFRNVIGQYIGRETSKLEPRVTMFDTEPGDEFVVMSDGVCDNLLDSEMGIVMSTTSDPQEQAIILVQTAMMRSKQGTMASKPDDMSAVVAMIDV